jgi:hypothetical protein
MDHALVEHGLAPAREPDDRHSPAPARPSRALGARLAGAPLDIAMELAVDGELPPREFDRLINVLREGTATLGTTTARTRELGWRGAWLGHRLDVAVVPDQGRTRIRLTQSIRRAAFGAMAATTAAAGIGGPVLGAALFQLLQLPAPSWGVPLTSAANAVISGTVGTLFAAAAIPAGRGLVRWLRRYNAARLQTLAELLAARVGEGIEEG